MSNEELNIVIAIASIFTAIGTISAVIVSLYLARGDKRINLEIIGQLGTEFTLFGISRDIDSIDLVYFTVTNLGKRSAVINLIEFQIGLFKKIHLMIIFDPLDLLSTKLPHKLNDGEQVIFRMKPEDFCNETILKYVRVGKWISKFNFIRICVRTTSKNIFTSKLDKNLLGLLINHKLGITGVSTASASSMQSK
ncbi:MAG: hypothetical protein AB1521_06030 [Bacteroidota bacterium]